VTLGDDLVGITTLHDIHAVECEIIGDEQVNSEEFTQLDFVGVVETGMLERFEHFVSAYCQHGVAVAAGNMAKRVREKRFPDADQASDILPIRSYSRLPFTIDFTHVTVSGSVLFVNMGFAENAPMLSNRGMEH
jgi:hypothetical protein